MGKPTSNGGPLVGTLCQTRAQIKRKSGGTTCVGGGIVKTDVDRRDKEGENAVALADSESDLFTDFYLIYSLSQI